MVGILKDVSDFGGKGAEVGNAEVQVGLGVLCVGPGIELEGR